MLRPSTTLISLLAILVVTEGLVLSADNSDVRKPPNAQAIQASVPAPAADATEVSAGSVDAEELPKAIPATSPSDFMGYRFGESPADNSFPASADSTSAAAGSVDLNVASVEIQVLALDDFMGYRYSAGSLGWIPGGGDQFGMFSIVSDHYQKAGITHGLNAGLGFHFLAGPRQTDMPPRVYDFSLAYQLRQRLGPLAFDLCASVLAASDFNGNARKGILFPGHGVGYLTIHPDVDLVFGVDYLDRGDIKLLPVGGIVWTPTPELRFELVFPRPRAVFQFNDRNRFYVSGELGGGSWAIERVSRENDLATYRDLRVCIGIETVQTDGRCSALEVGYLFDRRLEYTSGIGDMPLNDSVIMRLVTRY